jgi:hypothetical protein
VQAQLTLTTKRLWGSVGCPPVYHLKRERPLHCDVNTYL